MIPSAKISLLIEQICKKYDINYLSHNPDKIQFCANAVKLGECCQTILVMIDEIDIILNKHQIKAEFKEKIIREIDVLHNLEHDLVKLSQELKEEHA